MGPGARAPCPRDGFLVEEVTQTGFAFPVCGPRRYVTCGYQDNLGFGFDTALGVKVAHSGKAVVSISGAGGFLFGVRELATAVQNHIDVVPVVFDNAAYGDVLRDQPQSYRGRTIGSKLVNPDFVALARSFGIRSLRVDTAHALGIGEADEKCSTNYDADEVYPDSLRKRARGVAGDRNLDSNFGHDSSGLPHGGRPGRSDRAGSGRFGGASPGAASERVGASGRRLEL